jgi:hypothetical protein
MSDLQEFGPFPIMPMKTNDRTRKHTPRNPS